MNNSITTIKLHSQFKKTILKSFTLKKSILISILIKKILKSRIGRTLNPNSKGIYFPEKFEFGVIWGS